jgi:hypothetical protein
MQRQVDYRRADARGFTGEQRALILALLAADQIASDRRLPTF